MRRKTLSEIKGKCSLISNKKNYLHRGKYEQEALAKSSNIIGRTTWDRAYAYFIAPKSRYYFCNENLRSVFYEGTQWEYEKCNKFQIAISQASYPIKGLHKIIEAVALLRDEFPDIKVKVGGANIFEGNWIKGNSYSCHPRSRKRLEQSGFQLDKRVIQHEPLGFHDYNCLQMNAFCVVSDSGTLPEESSFFTSVGHPFPAVCIRTSTERPEALDKGDFILAGIDGNHLLQAVDVAVEMNKNRDLGIPVPDYVDENVSDKVVKIIQSYTGVIDKMVWRKY